MDPNYMPIMAPQPNPGKKKYAFIAAALVAIVALGVLAWWGVSRQIAQPEAHDYAQLNADRQIADGRVGAYEEIFADYYDTYVAAFASGLADKEKQELHHAAQEKLEAEQKASTSLLRAMSSSVTMKNEDVKARFDEYEKQYQAILGAGEQGFVTYTNMVKSVGGPCKQTTQVTFTTRAGARDYVRVADECLAALEQAREGSDELGRTYFSDITAAVKAQRAKFEAYGNSSASTVGAARTDALSSLVEMNTKMVELQATYQQRMKERDAALQDEYKKASDALADVLAGKTRAMARR